MARSVRKRKLVEKLVYRFGIVTNRCIKTEQMSCDETVQKSLRFSRAGSARGGAIIEGICSGRGGDEEGIVVRTRQIRRCVPCQQIPGSGEALRGILRDCFGASGTADLAIFGTAAPRRREEPGDSRNVLNKRRTSAGSRAFASGAVRLHICSVLEHGCAG